MLQRAQTLKLITDKERKLTLEIEKIDGKHQVNLQVNPLRSEQVSSYSADGFDGLLKQTISRFNMNFGHKNGTVKEIHQVDEAYWVSIAELNEIFPHLEIVSLPSPEELVAENPA